MEATLAFVQSQVEVRHGPVSPGAGRDGSCDNHDCGSGLKEKGEALRVDTKSGPDEACSKRDERTRKCLSLAWDFCVVICMVVVIIVMSKLPALLASLLRLMDQKAACRGSDLMI